MSDQRDPARLKFLVVAGLVMLLAGTLDSLTLLRGVSVLGVAGIIWGAASAVLVVLSVRRLRRDGARQT